MTIMNLKLDFRAPGTERGREGEGEKKGGGVEEQRK